MKYRVSLNANQARSFDEQVAQGTPQTGGTDHIRSPCLNALHAAFTGVKVPVVEGMSEQAVRMKVSHENRRQGIRCGAPFPQAVPNDCPSTEDLPPLQCEQFPIPLLTSTLSHHLLCQMAHLSYLENSKTP